MANYEKTGILTHVDASGNTYELYPQTKVEMVEGLSLFGPVTTAGTGAAYTATVAGIAELKVGVKLTIIPHTVSTTYTPTLDVNGLGAKYIRMPGTYNTATMANIPVKEWLVAGKPVTLTWEGEQWETDVHRPTAASITGTVAIKNGGTGASTLEEAKAALGISQLSSEIEDLKENGVGTGTAVSSVEPSEDDIPKVFFDEAMPQTKDDVVTAFRYISKTKDITGHAEFKAQGNSSMNYPKKNETVKMYVDADCTEKLKVDFKSWGKQNKHVYKANWIDITHARNIVSARLWADVVKSRENYLSLPDLLRTSPNQGAVDGFPVKVYSQGIYQGRYTINIPKDSWMANMDDSLDTHCILYGENYLSGCFRATANIDGTDWTDEVHDTVPSSIKARWNDVISFVMNSTDEDFKNNLGNYFFVDSLIDYFIFGMVSCGLDAFGKNQIYFTYDGIKWIASMYDMDSTWGLYWDGATFVSPNYSRESFEDFVSGRSGNLLYIRLLNLFHDEILTRYEELKHGVLSIPNIINHFERFTDIAPLDLVKEDYASTTGSVNFINIPSQTTNNIQQIRKFVVDRYVYCDSYFYNLAEPILPDLVYSLEQETELDGVDDYIDTGVMLFDTTDDFGILLDYSGNSSYDWSDCIFHCMYEEEPWNGLTMNIDPYYAKYSIASAENRINLNQSAGSTNRVKLAISRSGSTSIIRASDGTNTTLQTTTATFQQNVLIGCYQTTSGEKGRFWKGTIHECKIYKRQLTDEEITNFING